MSLIMQLSNFIFVDEITAKMEVDTPCTIDNHIAMLKKAGFSSAEMVWRMENTTIIAAKK